MQFRDIHLMCEECQHKSRLVVDFELALTMAQGDVEAVLDQLIMVANMHGWDYAGDRCWLCSDCSDVEALMYRD